jgi:hypothetical protein
LDDVAWALKRERQRQRRAAKKAGRKGQLDYTALARAALNAEPLAPLGPLAQDMITRKAQEIFELCARLTEKTT